MQNDHDVLKKQIAETSTILNLGSDIIEKDFYVTKAIHSLASIEDDNYRLIFQGGTCLSKAHQIVLRMSEDCDFRIEADENLSSLSRTQQRKCIKDLRDNIVSSLEADGFDVDKENLKVCDEGRFINLQLEFSSVFLKTNHLKPFIAVDLFLDGVKSSVVSLPITTLIQKTLGDGVNHEVKDVSCVSVVETAAEKWVGLTRRLATIKHREYYNDPTLVRHIYDLYKIQEIESLDKEFHGLVQSILKNETEKFKTHNNDYFENPIKEIQRSYSVLLEPNWKANWDNFVEDMVFEKDPPTFEEAINKFFELSKTCVVDLENVFFHRG